MVTKISNLGNKIPFPVKFHNISEGFKTWIDEAEKRIFSLAAGKRISTIALAVMKIGFGKVLYAANELGADFEKDKPYVIFAPDGTISLNKERTKRGFSYGCNLRADFGGMIATCNSMPNACGYTFSELIDKQDDTTLKTWLKQKQLELGKEYMPQLGKGNHFTAVYRVRDILTGEDTGRRFVMVHSSGGLGSEYLYNLTWLKEEEGYHEVETPHGPISFLEGEAKKRYLKIYQEGDKKNEEYRKTVMNKHFGKKAYKILETITHQGLSKDGCYHKLGIQTHQGLLPIAFNPEEGILVAKPKQNLTREFIDTWEYKEEVEALNLYGELTKLDFCPHGGGYEFKVPIEGFEMFLSPEGIESLKVHTLTPKGKKKEFSANYFREIREILSFRRKLPLMREVYRAGLAEPIFDLTPLMQVYPLVSIVGGTL